MSIFVRSKLPLMQVWQRHRHCGQCNHEYNQDVPSVYSGCIDNYIRYLPGYTGIPGCPGASRHCLPCSLGK